MPRPPLPVFAALCASLLAACGGDGTGPANTLPAALVGAWQAGPSCRAAGCAITARVEGSGTVLPLTDSVAISLDIRATGGITSTLTRGGSTLTLLGVGRTLGANTLIVDYSGAAVSSDTVTYSTQGALLRFDFQNVANFTVGGETLPLRLSVLFARR